MARKAKEAASENGRKSPERTVYVLVNGEGDIVRVVTKADMVFAAQEDDSSIVAKRFVLNA